MPMELAQHAIVTLVVLGAAVTLVRRVVGFVRPPAKGESGCKTCASGKTGTSTCVTVRPDASASQAHPAVLYRPGAR